MRIALYARISTDKQDTTNQLVELREFASKQGWHIVAEFVDTCTGGTSKRPEFQRMFQAASNREFDLLLFWSLDRLSRQGVLETLQHLNRLTEAGIAYRSLTEPYLDSCGVFKDAIISIMATLAKQEKLRISERTKAGLAVARARGQRLGAPRRDVDVSQLLNLYKSGRTIRQMSHEMDVPAATIRARLNELRSAA